jgi:hypothetical protein
MIKRLIAFAAVLAIAVMTAGGGVASAHRGTTGHHVRAAHHAAHHKAARHAASEGAGESEESATEEPGDGPGGHEDEPGAEVDHQFEGVE